MSTLKSRSFYLLSLILFSIKVFAGDPVVDQLVWAEGVGLSEIICGGLDTKIVLKHTSSDGDGSLDGWDTWKIEINLVGTSLEQLKYMDGGAQFVERSTLDNSNSYWKILIGDYLESRDHQEFSGTIRIRVHGINYEGLTNWEYNGKWSEWAEVTYMNGNYGTNNQPFYGPTKTFVDHMTYYYQPVIENHYRVKIRQGINEIDDFLLHSKIDGNKRGWYKFQNPGDYTLRSYHTSYCGTLSTNYKTLDIHVSPEPGKPLGASSVVSGETITLDFTNRDSEASYEWDIQPSNLVTKEILSDKRCRVTFNHTSLTNFTVKVRGVVEGDTRYTERYTAYSPSKTISGFKFATPDIQGSETYCYNPGSPTIQYTAYNGYNYDAVEWDIDGSGATIDSDGTVTLTSGAGTFTVKARFRDGSVYSAYNEKRVTRLGGDNTVDFSGVKLCSGNGDVEITGIEPAGGEYWFSDAIQQTTIYPQYTYYVDNQPTENVQIAINEEKVFYSAYFRTTGSVLRENALQCNFSSIPEDAIIINATLRLYFTPEYHDPMEGKIGMINGYFMPGTYYSVYDSQKLKYNIDIEEKTIQTTSTFIDIDITEILIRNRESIIYIEPSKKRLYTFYTPNASQSLKPRVIFQYSSQKTINTNTVGNSKRVTYRINESGCSTYGTETVSVLQAPSVNFSAPEICQNESNIELTQGSSNITGIEEYLGVGMTSSNMFTPGDAGDYEITYRCTNTQNGCSSEATDILRVKELPNPDINVPDDICGGNLINLSIIGSYSNTSWEFDGITRFGNSTSFQTAPSNNGSETITLETTLNGCTNTIEKTVQLHELPDLNLVDLQVCQNEYKTIYPDIIDQGYLDYMWSDGTTLESMSLTVNSATPYSLTVTDIYGCSSSDNASIFMKNPPTVSVVGATACEGERVTLEALPYNPSWKYRWSSGYGSSNVVDLVPINTGANIVTVFAEGDNGCWGSTTAQVYVNQNPEISLQDKDGCIGVPNTINAPGGFRNYIWSTGLVGSNNLTLTPFSPGNQTISCEVEDYNGCRGSDQMILNVHTPRSFSLETLNDEEFCIGSAATLRGPDGDYEYRWSNGSNQQTTQFNLYSSSNYSLTLTDIFGCDSEDDIFVQARELPQVSINPVTICQNEEANLVANPQNYISYNWSHGAFGSQTIVNPMQTTSYLVTVTDDLGCDAEYSTTVFVNPEPSFTLADQIVCYGETTNITVNGSFPQVVWNTGATGDYIQVVANETQNYSATVTNTFGCSNSEEMTLQVMQPAPLIIEDVDACEGETVTLVGPDNFTHHQWSNGVNYRITDVVANQTSNYSLTAVDMNGCDNTVDFTVYANPYPIVEIPDFGVNEGDSRTVNAPGGYEYLWSTGHIDQSIIVTPYETTDYWVRVTTLKGCSAQDTFTVSVYDLPEIIMQDIEICNGETITLEGPEGEYVRYSWTINEEVHEGSIASIQPESTSICHLEVENSTGGIGGTSFLITVNETPAITCDDEYLICYGESATLESREGESTYNWSTGEHTNSITVSPSVTSNYSLQVTSANGCVNNKEIEVIVDNPNTQFTASSEYIVPGDPVQFMVNTINETHSYTWEFGDGTAGEGSNPINYYYYEGHYDVTLNTSSDNGCNASTTYEDFISVNTNNTGVSSIDDTKGINYVVFPNPVRNYSTLVADQNMIGNEVFLKILSVEGKVITNSKLKLSKENLLDLSDYPEGTYYLSITSKDHNYTKKLLKVE